ncbi:uncharacterized protein LOC134242023 [Saccostrea cucullata]|uniref:uncharacterized protein LOC134242023 n=1 Tax=Saccostrea cuccullata TaxID=36930 RepID=UPI002ED4C411
MNEIALDIGDSSLGMVVIWERNSSIKTVGKKELLDKVTKALSRPSCNHGKVCVPTSSSENNVDFTSEGGNSSVGLENNEDNSLQTSAQCQSSKEGDSEKNEKEKKMFKKSTTGKRSHSEMLQKSKEIELSSPHVLHKRVKMTSLLKSVPSILVKVSSAQGTQSEEGKNLSKTAPSKQVNVSNSQSSLNKEGKTLLKPEQTKDGCSQSFPNRQEEPLPNPPLDEKKDRSSEEIQNKVGDTCTLPKPAPVLVKGNCSQGTPSKGKDTLPKPAPVQVKGRSSEGIQNKLRETLAESASVRAEDNCSQGPTSEEKDALPKQYPAIQVKDGSSHGSILRTQEETLSSVKEDKIISTEELKDSKKVNKFPNKGKNKVITETEIEKVLEDFSSNLGEESRETSYAASDFKELQKSKPKYGRRASNLIRCIRTTIFQAVKYCKKLNEIAHDIGDVYLSMVVVWERNSSIKTVGNKALLKKIAKVLSPPSCNYDDVCDPTSSHADEETVLGENGLSATDNTKLKTSELETENNESNLSKETNKCVELNSGKKDNGNKVSRTVTSGKRNSSEKNEESDLSPQVLLKRVRMTSLLKPASSVQVNDTSSQGTPSNLVETLLKPALGKDIESLNPQSEMGETLEEQAPAHLNDSGSQGPPSPEGEKLLELSPVQVKDTSSEGSQSKWEERLPIPAHVPVKGNISPGTPSKEDTLPKPASVQVKGSSSEGIQNKHGETLPKPARVQVNNSGSQSPSCKQANTLTCVKDGKIISLEELQKEVELALKSPNTNNAPKFYLQKIPSGDENFNKAIINSSGGTEKVTSVQTRALPQPTQLVPINTQRLPHRQPMFLVAPTPVTGRNSPKLSAAITGGQSQVRPVKVFINHQIIPSFHKIGSLAAKTHTMNSTQINNSPVASTSAQMNSTQISNVSDLAATSAQKNSTQLSNISDSVTTTTQKSSEPEHVPDSVTESCSSEADELKFSIVVKETDTGEYKMYKVPISNTDQQTQEVILPELEGDGGVTVKCEPTEEWSGITPYSQSQSGVTSPHSQSQSGVTSPHSQSQSGVTSPHSQTWTGINASHSQNQSAISHTESSEMGGDNVIVKTEPVVPSVSSHHRNTNINKYKNPQRITRSVTRGQTQKVVECPYEYALQLDSVPKRKKESLMTFWYRCKQCCKSFKYASSLEVHKRMHDHREVEKTKKNRCYICKHRDKYTWEVHTTNLTSRHNVLSENTFHKYTGTSRISLKTHSSKYTPSLKTHSRQQKEKNESVNPASTSNQPVIPTDQGAMEGETLYKRNRQKRRIIVDDCERGLIPTETMKRQFRDTSDITGPME